MSINGKYHFFDKITLYTKHVRGVSFHTQNFTYMIKCDDLWMYMRKTYKISNLYNIFLLGQQPLVVIFFQKKYFYVLLTV